MTAIDVGRSLGRLRRRVGEMIDPWMCSIAGPGNPQCEHETPSWQQATGISHVFFFSMSQEISCFVLTVDGTVEKRLFIMLMLLE